MKSKRWLFGALGLFSILSGMSCSDSDDGASSGPSGPPVIADYGDAPDGGRTDYPSPFTQTGAFPTLYASGGAHTLSVDDATLGAAASLEEDADDVADPDGAPNLTNADSDDGLVNFFMVLNAIPPPTTMTVKVNAPANSAGGTFYLNAVADLNMDGQWGGTGANNESEWIVQNHSVTVVPGDSTTVTPDPFAFTNGNIVPDGAYMRIALTKEMVSSSNWNGTGQFSSGEIEDHVVDLPEVGGKKNPVLRVDCNGPYVPGDDVECEVVNMRNVAGNFTYTVVRTGTGTVPVFGGAPPSPVAINGLETKVITFNSGPGDTPDTWRFTAKVQDPDAVVVTGGIQLGHSEESTGDFSFASGESSACADHDGEYGTTVTGTTDPSSHSPYVGDPFAEPLTVTITGSTVTIAGVSPFVAVMGTIDSGCNFTATGSGVVAGYSDIKVEMKGTFSSGGLSGTYEMGADGGLPGGESITYAITGTSE